MRYVASLPPAKNGPDGAGRNDPGLKWDGSLDCVDEDIANELPATPAVRAVTVTTLLPEGALAETVLHVLSDVARLEASVLVALEPL